MNEPLSCPVIAQLLRWSVEDSLGDFRRLLDRLAIEEQTSESDKFDVIVASDCLFFKEFHFDLLWTLRAGLRVGGIALLLQPLRGGTVDLFLERLAHYGGFSFEVLTEYHTKVNEELKF